MIQANAKCVVNGKKLNELISWINGSMEQLDVVDQNNYASKRWFLVSDADNINQGTNPDPSRDKMQREGGGGAQGNRDKLNKAVGGGQGGGGRGVGGTGTGTGTGGGQDIPMTSGGNVDMRSLEALVKSGNASPYQKDVLNKMQGGGGGAVSSGGGGNLDARAGADRNIPMTSGGHVDMRALQALVNSGNASQYQKDVLSKMRGSENDAINRDRSGDIPTSSGALRDDGTTTRTGPQPSGALRDDGTTTRTGPQPSGALRDDGFVSPPRPGAPPPNADDVGLPGAPPPNADDVGFAAPPKNGRIAGYHNNATYGTGSRDDVRKYKQEHLTKIRDRIKKYTNEIKQIDKQYPDIQYANSKAPQSVRSRFDELLKKRNSAYKKQKMIQSM